MRAIIAWCCACLPLAASETPTITAPERSAADPTWSWVGGGGSGQYAFRVVIDDIDHLSASHTAVQIDGEAWNGPVNLGSFTYDATDLAAPALAHGDSVTLELRELDGVSWSPAASATIRIDTAGPRLILVDPPGSLAAGQEIELVLQARDGEPEAAAEQVAALGSALSVNQGTITTLIADPEDASRILVTLTCANDSHELVLTPTADLCTDLAGNACQVEPLPGILVSRELATVATSSGVVPFGYSAGASRQVDELQLAGARLLGWDSDVSSWQPADSLAPGQAAVIVSNTPVLPSIPDAPLSGGSFVLQTRYGWNLISLPFAETIPWHSSLLLVRRFGEELDLATAAERGWCEAHAWLWAAGNDGYLLLGEDLRGPGTTDALPPWNAAWWYVKTVGLELVVDADLLQDQ